MKTRKLIATLISTAFLGLTANGRADDIDLYATDTSSTGAKTNIVFFIDNSANWNSSFKGGTPVNCSGSLTNATQGSEELLALKSLVNSPSIPETTNIGLMMHVSEPDADGAYVRFSIRPMTTANKAVLTTVIDQIIQTSVCGGEGAAPDEQSAQNVAGERSIEEIYRYLKGSSVAAAGRDNKADYSGNTDYYDKGPFAADPHPAAAIFDTNVPAEWQHAYASKNAGTYEPPSTVSDGCAKTYVIWIGNTYIGATGSATADLSRLKAAGVAPAYAAPTDGYVSSDGSNKVTAMDEFAHAMNTVGLAASVVPDASIPGQQLVNKVITYTVDVAEYKNTKSQKSEPEYCKDDTASGATIVNQHAVLESMAEYGGGKCFPAQNAEQLSKALNTIMAEIQAVNSVFASATLPISVNTQGTYENQVYIGVFRPDASAGPRWYGNVKEYKFARYCDGNFDEIVKFPVGTDGTGSPISSATFTPIAADERIGDEVVGPNCCAYDDYKATCEAGKKVEVKLYLADKNGKPAIDQISGTGFIDGRATSYWSKAKTTLASVTSDFWSFLGADTYSLKGDAPDGPLVERGGAAQLLREKFARAATAPYPYGRTIYSCIGTCKTAGNTLLTTSNAFTESNMTAAIKLQRPPGTYGSATDVTAMTRVGTLVTVTTSANPNNFLTGTKITIGGANPADYEGTWTVTAGPASNQFQFDLAEKGISEGPPVTAIATVSAAAGTATYVLSGITLPATALPGHTVTAEVTVSNANGNSLSVNDSVTLNNTKYANLYGNQPFLQGSKTVSAVTPSSGSVPTKFSFPVTVPTPANSTGGTSKAGSGPAQTITNGTLIHSGTGTSSSVVTVTIASGTINLSKFALGNTVVISGTANSIYDGTWIIGGCPTTTTQYCFKPYAPASDTGSGGSPSSFNAQRLLGGSCSNAAVSRSSMTVTIDIAAPAICSAGVSITSFPVSSATSITGSNPLGYDTAGTPVTVVSNDNVSKITYTLASTTPLSPATRTISTEPITAKPLEPPPPSTDALVRWMHGLDNYDDEDIGAHAANVRASIHGDVLHSRPALINYGGTIGIVGFYGSNDGYLRAIAAGTGEANVPSTRKDTHTDDGYEKWAFIPEEFLVYNDLKRLYFGSPRIRFPNLACPAPGVADPEPRRYFWDGNLAVYQSTTTTPYTVDTVTYSRPSKTYLYASMRRGGRVIYALDVSEPDNPKFLWRIAGGEGDDFDKLGYTWSEPKVARIAYQKDGATVTRNVVIFGAGYNPGLDDRPSGSAYDASKATYAYGVYIVDYESGALIARLDHGETYKYSFAADVTLVDMDGDEIIDRIYAGDTGGQLFRFDIEQAKELGTAEWGKAYTLAKLGDPNGGANARKFLYPPEVLPFVYKSALTGIIYPGIQSLILVGTGDREKPLKNDPTKLGCLAADGGYYPDNYFGTPVNEKFYGIIDPVDRARTLETLLRPAGTEPAIPAATDLLPINTVGSSLSEFKICFGFESNCTTTQIEEYLGKQYLGWYIDLKDAEEKLVSAPRVLSGIVYFGTNAPQGVNKTKGVCSGLGVARAYAADPFSGLPKFDRNNSGTKTQDDFSATILGGGLPPSVTAGVVGIGQDFYRFAIGAGGTSLVATSPIAGAKNPVTLQGVRSRVYWYYQSDDR